MTSYLTFMMKTAVGALATVGLLSAGDAFAYQRPMANASTDAQLRALSSHEASFRPLISHLNIPTRRLDIPTCTLGDQSGRRPTPSEIAAALDVAQTPGHSLSEHVPFLRRGEDVQLRAPREATEAVQQPAVARN